MVEDGVFIEFLGKRRVLQVDVRDELPGVGVPQVPRTRLGGSLVAFTQLCAPGVPGAGGVQEFTDGDQQRALS